MGIIIAGWPPFLRQRPEKNTRGDWMFPNKYLLNPIIESHHHRAVTSTAAATTTTDHPATVDFLTFSRAQSAAENIHRCQGNRVQRAIGLSHRLMSRRNH